MMGLMVKYNVENQVENKAVCGPSQPLRCALPARIGFFYGQNNGLYTC